MSLINKNLILKVKLSMNSACFVFQRHYGLLLSGVVACFFFVMSFEGWIWVPIEVNWI